MAPYNFQDTKRYVIPAGLRNFKRADVRHGAWLKLYDFRWLSVVEWDIYAFPQQLPLLGNLGFIMAYRLPVLNKKIRERKWAIAPHIISTGNSIVPAPTPFACADIDGIMRTRTLSCSSYNGSSISLLFEKFCRFALGHDFARGIARLYLLLRETCCARLDDTLAPWLVFLQPWSLGNHHNKWRPSRLYSICRIS